MILCALREDSSPHAEDDFEILITRRTERLETHKGQYALPGGSVDAEDGPPGSEMSLVTAALRETEEEVGIRSERIRPFGVLPPIWTPTGFLVTPVLGLLDTPLEKAVVIPSEEEIDLWFWCRMSRLRSQEIYSVESREISLGGETIRVPVDVFQIDAHRVWGATGAILKNFIGRWEKLG
ncbi:MAG: CoA pyrophosphatase [Cryobacterium sp.]|nr:CoA pyrophosphatase [Oligoflexia bacterium]